VDSNRCNRPGLARIPRTEKAELNPKPVNPQHLDHAVRTGLISAALIGTSIGILYGLTHSVQIGTALTDAIGIYADSSGVTFNTGSPLIASMVSIIPAVIGGVAGAGAPIGALTLARWLQLGPAVQLLAGGWSSLSRAEALPGP